MNKDKRNSITNWFDDEEKEYREYWNSLGEYLDIQEMIVLIVVEIE